MLHKAERQWRLDHGDAWGEALQGAFQIFVSEDGHDALRVLTTATEPRRRVLDRVIMHPSGEGDLYTRVEIGEGRLVAAGQGWAHVCAQGERQYVSLARPGGEISPLGDHQICTWGDDLVAGWRRAVTWQHQRGNQIPTFKVWAFDQEEISLDRDFGFNPSGRHRYGDIVSAAVGADRVVVDTVSETYSWVLSLEPEGGALLHDPAMAIEGEEVLLGVSQQLAFYATEDHVVAMDLSDPWSPTLHPTRWPIRQAGGADVQAPELLFVDAEWLIFRGRDGGVAIHALGSEARHPVFAGECP